MAAYALNPCPQCGRRFDFPLTGCMTYVAEWLTANSHGKCPDCGTTVVVDQPQPVSESLNPIAAARTQTEKLNVKVVDLPLSVGCRNKIQKMNLITLGELLQFPKESIRQGLADSPNCFEQIESLLDEHGMEWPS